MSRICNVLPYTRPVGASDEDAARAGYLTLLRRSGLTKTERGDGVVKDTLCDLSAKYDRGQQRFTPPARKKNLRNVEFLAALILDGEGRSAAVPPI